MQWPLSWAIGRLEEHLGPMTNSSKDGLVAACGYTAVALLFTWPVVIGLTRDVPSDLGDPVFVSWVLSWAGDHWLAWLGGDWNALTSFWNAPMFYPETLTTALSEHFAAHALQILPVWAATRNAILGYNLLFLASYVLSGLGMYLLVRDLTGQAPAAWIAGLAFMCTPYRIVALSHLQVLTAQWMPFALLGLHRYLARGHTRALAAGAAAIWLQNLASGYYLIFFAPFAAAFAVTEVVARSLTRCWRVWRHLAIAAVATLLATMPFALPYLVLQRRSNYRRPLAEIEPQSADLFAWFLADPRSTVWGRLASDVPIGGGLFMGLTAMLLAAIGAVAAIRRPASVSVNEKPTARAIAVFAVIGIAMAVWIALGPTPRWSGQPTGLPSIFVVLYDYVPGFDVSRAPSRFAMMVALLLALLAGYGAAWLNRGRLRSMLPLLGLALIAEGAIWPLPINRVIWSTPLVLPPEGRVHPEATSAPVWRYLRTLPPQAVVAHLPFGVIEYEIRYQFYSNGAQHRTINGYSGNIPSSYVARLGVLREPLANPNAAWAKLRADGVTHVVLHGEAWPDTTASSAATWLQQMGAQTLVRLGSATVYALPPP